MAAEARRQAGEGGAEGPRSPQTLTPQASRGGSPESPLAPLTSPASSTKSPTLPGGLAGREAQLAAPSQAKAASGRQAGAGIVQPRGPGCRSAGRGIQPVESGASEQERIAGARQARQASARLLLGEGEDDMGSLVAHGDWSLAQDGSGWEGGKRRGAGPALATFDILDVGPRQSADAPSASALPCPNLGRALFSVRQAAKLARAKKTGLGARPSRLKVGEEQSEAGREGAQPRSEPRRMGSLHACC